MMNIKRVVFISAALFIGLIIYPWVMQAKDDTEPPEAMYIQSSIYDATRLRPPVEFTHKNHAEEYGLDCSECHHEYTEGEPVKKCTECHKAEPTDEVGVTMKQAMHQTCRACHQDVYKKDPKSSVPYTCAACHSEIDHFKFQNPRQQPSVTFTHLYHYRDYKIACTTCHHRYVNGQNVWQQGDPVQKCQTCHFPETKNGVVKLKTAFHSQCESCHKTLVQGGTPAPVHCEECHVVRLSFKKAPKAGVKAEEAPKADN